VLRAFDLGPSGFCSSRNFSSGGPRHAALSPSEWHGDFFGGTRAPIQRNSVKVALQSFDLFLDRNGFPKLIYGEVLDIAHGLLLSRLGIGVNAGNPTAAHPGA
jgi:hypothetical protein